MEFQERLYSLSERIKQLSTQIKTEEATKQSFIMPFFQILGYDVFNPLEFCPEFTADVGIKKGEKVDYAIFIEEKPFVLIEAKGCFEKLEKHDSQLFRYFATTESKFAILTNGIIYRFYTDLDAPNKMDSEPFFELDMLNLNDLSLNYLSNFMKININVENILSSATELKYLSLAKSAFSEILANPTDDFVKMIISEIYTGTKTSTVVEKFKPIIKKGINQYINDKMSARFKETLSASEISDIEDNPQLEAEENKIITTVDEINAFAIVKSILRTKISARRITYKDTESYFGILLDGNIRKWICRINITTKGINLFIPDDSKNPIRYSIVSMDDIYDFSSKLNDALERYLS